MNDQAGYTHREVAFLLSFQDHEAALAYATKVPDSLGSVEKEQAHLGTSTEDGDAPFIARWAEVHTAKNKIETNKENLALTQLRLQGHSEEEVAALLGIGRRTVGRRMRATLHEILTILGTEPDPPPRLDHIDLCLICGEHPRGRSTRRTRTWTGTRWKTKTRDRASSLCTSCLQAATELFDENGKRLPHPNATRGGIPWPA